ncbi:MAG: cardiolipin synthase B [Streptosporangiales bacterium]|nr:cardiolipin synthase B [Streptosporangiales bacterium]
MRMAQRTRCGGHATGAARRRLTARPGGRWEGADRRSPGPSSPSGRRWTGSEGPPLLTAWRRSRSCSYGTPPGHFGGTDGRSPGSPSGRPRRGSLGSIPCCFGSDTGAVDKRWLAGLAVAGAAGYAGVALRSRLKQADEYHLDGEALHVGEPGFLRAAETLTGAPISTGNEIELLINGDRIFPAFLDTIAGAEHTLNLVTYVYWRGDIAGEVASALCAKATDGIRVNVLLDAVGTARMDNALLDQMQRAGVNVVRFRPPRSYAVRRLTHRTHRRILIADGRVGMTGGVGIAEEWTGDAHDPDHWRDTHVRVRGPVVRGLQGAFAENWLEATGDVLAGPDYLPEFRSGDGGGPMQVVRSAAGVGDTNVEALYFLALASARGTLDLTAGYFVPRVAFVRALCDAARRGVRVRVLVPGPHVDKEFVRVAGRSTYADLLDCGVRIWEYQPTMLHAKTLCVDGVWSSVGSVNFDNRSFRLNDEATLCVQSDAFAAQLTEQFERDIVHSEEFPPERWHTRPLRQRAHEQLLRLTHRQL